MSSESSEPTKVVIIGAGPVGCLAAVYACNRGFQVEIYERGDDCQEQDHKPCDSSKSINLSLATRGLEALRGSKNSKLYQDVSQEAAIVHSRMVHGVGLKKTPTTMSSDYDVFGGSLVVFNRSFIVERLLNAVRDLPNAKVFFKHKLVSCDLEAKEIVIESANLKSPDFVEMDCTADPESIDRDPTRMSKVITYDLLIGADGAHSVVREAMGRQSQANLQTQWLDIHWCELSIPPAANGDRKLSGEHLHVWPQNDHLFIALPNAKDNGFTSNLFGPSSLFQSLEANPDKIVQVFEHSFPGVISELIDPEHLVDMFSNNPHSALVDIRCSPFNFKNTCVLVGDAANTMVPFYGQGLNSGLEDVQILFEKFLDTAPLSIANGIPDDLLRNHSTYRKPDVDTINQLAMEHYHELCVKSRLEASKTLDRIDEFISRKWPSSGWRTLYHRIAFSTERYSLAKAAHEGQRCILYFLVLYVFLALVTRVIFHKEIEELQDRLLMLLKGMIP